MFFNLHFNVLKHHCDDTDGCHCGCGHDHDDTCDCGCNDEELDFDLRPVSETQVACPGIDLIDMLVYDEDVTDETFKRLHLTPHVTEDEAGYEEVTFDEIDAEGYYLISFPEGTDLSEIALATALSIEPISETCFNALDVPEDDFPCDGNCDDCPQECIGKQPVI